MSHSVLPESSAIDAPFVVGPDLVEFDRRDLPIYQMPESRWAEACIDDMPYGAPFDRLFGEPDPVFIDGVAGSSSDASLSPIGADALVTLSDLSDALLLPAADEPAGTAHDIAAIYDFGADSHAVVHLHDGWSWEQSAAEWSYDHHG